MTALEKNFLFAKLHTLVIANSSVPILCFCEAGMTRCQDGWMGGWVGGWMSCFFASFSTVS